MNSNELIQIARECGALQFRLDEISYCEKGSVVMEKSQLEQFAERIRAAALQKYTTKLPLDEWHEDQGDVLWWTDPVCEPPYCGTPLDDDWPGYHTHFTPLIQPGEGNP